jgi:large subunit ribosomal protein L13
MKTYHGTAKEVTRNWHLLDAKGMVLGRMATEISGLLMGKNKVTYSPHLDSGEYVVVINAKDVKLTGLKREQKVYRGHSGYPGGFKEVKFEAQMVKDPRVIVEKAVYGMLPGNRLRNKRMNRLKVFRDSKHTYQDKFVNEK